MTSITYNITKITTHIIKQNYIIACLYIALTSHIIIHSLVAKILHYPYDLSPTDKKSEPQLNIPSIG